MADQRPVVHRQYRGNRGVGLTAVILIGVVVVLDIASTWTTWNAYGVVKDYLAGDATDDDLASADDAISTVSLGFVLAVVAAGILVMAWLWQARTNAELRCPARHRRARAWIIWGWIVPVVNFWFPYQIVDDVYRASRPGNPSDLDDLRTVPGDPLIGVWWGLWVAALVLNRIVASLWDDVDSTESLQLAGIVEIAESAALAGAAVTFIMIMRQISGWQGSQAGAGR